jgi:hypothetical protein
MDNGSIAFVCFDAAIKHEEWVSEIDRSSTHFCLVNIALIADI